MKTIGLLGGMSWESTVLYYQLLNEGVRDRVGGMHSARITMMSVDFQPRFDQATAGEWSAMAHDLAPDMVRIEKAGADLILMCANTVHKIYDELSGAVSVPVLHIVDPTAEAIKAEGFKRVALLGTRFTMTEDFYVNRLAEFGIDGMVPNNQDKDIVHGIIFDELIHGVIREESRAKMLAVIQRLLDQGAEGVIAGCTEIPLLLKQEHLDVPLFDTTELHATAALDAVLG